MSRRDTYIIAVVAVFGAVGAFWLLALSPKREKLSAIDKDVAAAQQTLQQAKQDKVKFARDQIAFPRLYASLSRLGKAVPADQDVPSLLVQLNHAAAEANVNFHSVELKMSLAAKIEEGAAEASASASAAAPAGGTAAPAGSAGAGSTAPAGGEGAQPAAPAGQAAPPAGQAAPAGGTATATAGATTAAPAAGAAPTVGSAAPATAGQFKVLPFEYIFKGDFFDLEDLIHNITRLVERRNQELAVTGRLITIRGFSMKRGKVSVLATTYMLPADQGLFAGASPQGPPGTNPAAPQAAAAGSAAPVPPTAAVTSP
jgi:hypothetical protein